MTDIEIAKEHGRVYAKSFFKDFLDVKFQGPKFKWIDFPSVGRGICEASLFTSFREIPSNIKDLEVIAGNEFESYCVFLRDEYAKTNTLPVRIKN